MSEWRQQGEELVQIGIIGGTHGVKGEVRVQPTSDFEEDRLGHPGIKFENQFFAFPSDH